MGDLLTLFLLLLRRLSLLSPFEFFEYGLASTFRSNTFQFIVPLRRGTTFNVRLFGELLLKLAPSLSRHFDFCGSADTFGWPRSGPEPSVERTRRIQSLRVRRVLECLHRFNHVLGRLSKATGLINKRVRKRQPCLS
ncbi:MAG: hypothetical protein KDA71_07070, partial [Planctomycetales bacterium]|nr:hypothetical protein [Planctomycetales bacterium]